MSKELGKFCSLDDISLNISKCIVTKSLNNLWDVEECNVNGMTFKSTDCVLDNTRMVSVCWKKEGDGIDGIDRCPVHEILRLLAWASVIKREQRTLSWEVTSLGKVEPSKMRIASEFPVALCGHSRSS